MLKLKTLALAAALLAVGACKDKTQSAANNAAEEVNEKTADLNEEAKDLRETALNENADLNNKIADNREQLKEDLDSVGNKLADRAEDTREKAGDGVEKISEETGDIAKLSHEVADADGEFLAHKSIRIATLGAIHGIAASQPLLINAVSESVPFIAEDKAEIASKLTLLNQRLNEAKPLIDVLGTVEAKDWEPRERAAAQAMNRVEDAREDAFDALEDAKRVDDRTSMR